MRKINKDNYYVYVHTFPDGKKYVGITCQEPQVRWGKHGNGYSRQSKIWEAIQKYGWENIQHEIIRERLSSDEARQAEIELIASFNSIEDGYNIDNGGSLGSFEWTRVEYKGQKYYPSELKEMAVEGITAHDITTRLGRGWDVDRILSQPPEERTYRREYKGELYTIEELEGLPECVVDHQIIKDRLSRNWDVERAITQPDNKKKQPHTKKMIYEGREITVLDAIRIAKEKYGVILTEANVRDRVNRNWDIEDVLSKRKVSGNNNLYLFNGKQYTTIELVNLAKEKYGLIIDRVTVANRIRKGMSVEEAISSPLKTHKYKK